MGPFRSSRGRSNFSLVKRVSENTKIPSEMLTGRMALSNESAESVDNNPISEVEAQMRRALGLYGGMRPRTDHDRADQSTRTSDRFASQGGGHIGGGHIGGGQGIHRRRFVQDGEIPVTVLRRDTATESQTPQSSRLQRTEAALAAETAARERAERALHDAQAQIAALQTKIGHAELARIEAVDLAKREKEAMAQLRESSQTFEEQLQTLREQLEFADEARRQAQSALHDERNARKAAERALREMTERAEHAEASLRIAEEDAGQEDILIARRAIPARVPARRGRPAGSKSTLKPVAAVVSEAEPVKWWLNPTGKAKAR